MALTVVFTNDTLIAIGNATYDGQDIVVSNCTLTVNGPHPFTSLLVTSNGVVTHSPAPAGEAANSLNLMIGQDATVETGSRIDVSALGYGAQSGPGQGAGAYYGGGGGGYGGEGGGPGGTNYGSITAPVDFGSGGGPTWRIGFPTQSANGAYSFTVGPHIANLFGQEMAASYSGGFTVNFTTATTAVSQTGGNLSLIWPSATGLSYQLQSATNLPAASWLDEGAPLNQEQVDQQTHASQPLFNQPVGQSRDEDLGRIDHRRHCRAAIPVRVAAW